MANSQFVYCPGTFAFLDAAEIFRTYPGSYPFAARNLISMSALACTHELRPIWKRLMMSSEPGSRRVVSFGYTFLMIASDTQNNIENGLPSRTSILVAAVHQRHRHFDQETQRK